MHHPFVLLVVPQDHLLPEQYVVTMRDNLLDRCPVSSFEEVSGVWGTWGLSSAWGLSTWGAEQHVGAGRVPGFQLRR